MKKKTWIISALMYAMVFMACFGVLHFMKKLMEPAGPVQTEATAKGPEHASAGDDGRRTGQRTAGLVRPRIPRPKSRRRS